MSGSVWTVVLLTAFAVITVRCEQPKIVKGIFPAVKNTGETVSFACTVSNQQKNKVLWIQNVGGSKDWVLSTDIDIPDKGYVVDGKPKYEVSRQEVNGIDEVSYTLSVNRLTVEDAGRYICMIKLEGVKRDQWPKKFTFLTVIGSPTITRYRTSTDVTKELGNDVSLTCEATGTPTPQISWVRADGKPLPDGRRSHKGSVLKMANLKKDDIGFYRCVAENRILPPATRDIELSVFFKPEASPVQRSVGQSPSRRFNAVLKCRVDAVPEAKLRWYIERWTGDESKLITLTNSDKYEIQAIRDSVPHLGRIWYSLKINNVNSNDFGYYACEAQNRLGRSKEWLQLYESDWYCNSPGCSSSACLLNGLTYYSYKSKSFKHRCSASCACDSNLKGPGIWECVSLCPRNKVKGPGCKWVENPEKDPVANTNCCPTLVC